MALQSKTNASARWALAITPIAFFMVALDALVVITALPSIHRDLGASLTTLEWTVNAYTLAFAAGMMTAAALGDRFGRRRLFTLGLLLFSAASAACGLAPTAELLIAARVLQGLGAATIMPLSLTILTTAFPPERRGSIVGIWGGVAGLAAAGGPLVGGAITQGLDWHWIFWLNVPVGLVAALLSVLRLPETRGPATRLDLPAVALVSGGALGIVWGLIRGNEAGWASAEIVSALGLGILCIIGLVAWELGAPEPMLPMRLFANRSFAAANATGFMMTGALSAGAFLMAQYFQFSQGFSPLGTGLALLPWTIWPMIVAPVAGALSDRIGQRPIMSTGMLMQGTGFGWFALAASSRAEYAPLVLPLIIAGIGLSMAIAATSTAVMSSVAPPDMGKASGTNGTLRQLGAAFAIAVSVAVFSANGHIGTPTTFDSGFRPALAVAAGLSLLGALAALGVRRRLSVRPATVSVASFQIGAPTVSSPFASPSLAAGSLAAFDQMEPDVASKLLELDMLDYTSGADSQIAS